MPKLLKKFIKLAPAEMLVNPNDDMYCKAYNEGCAYLIHFAKMILKRSEQRNGRKDKTKAK